MIKQTLLSGSQIKSIKIGQSSKQLLQLLLNFYNKSNKLQISNFVAYSCIWCGTSKFPQRIACYTHADRAASAHLQFLEVPTTLPVPLLSPAPTGQGAGCKQWKLQKQGEPSDCKDERTELECLQFRHSGTAWRFYFCLKFKLVRAPGWHSG